MDALRYLIERRWPSSPKLGILLLLCTALCWLNFQATTLVPRHFPSVFNNSLIALLWGVLVLAASLVAIGTLLGVVVVVPLYAFYRTSGTLRSWIRQHAVEEMLCAGMTGRQILDCLALYGLRWWLMAALPSILVAIALFPALRAPWLPLAVVGYLLAGAVLTYTGLFSIAWSGFAGGKVKSPLLAAALIVLAVPALGLILTSASAPSLLLAGVYVVVVGRWAAIYGLENWEALGQFDTRVRRKLAGPRSQRPLTLSENPIVARQAMRGADGSDFVYRLVAVLGFALATGAALSLHALWPLAFLVVPLVLLNGYRAAGKMSQIVTEEIESSTLETVRSTPMSSDSFLKGWLYSVVRTQWIDLGALLVAVFSVVAGMGEWAVLTNPLVIVAVCLSAVMPVTGAFIGASIAGQGKTRAEISSQLFASFAAVAVVGAPNVMASTEVISLPFSLMMLFVVAGGLCWLLEAGAKKSLNRVFLPQR